ncbi:hypothetical protein KEM54_000611 [Ascosphaera aggregata]|nr:hypothetical protein KEM54_000611 [Ascosphaera aggregata]
MANEKPEMEVQQPSRANSIESNMDESTESDGSTLRRNLTIGTSRSTRSALSRQATTRTNRSTRSREHHVFVPSFMDNASVYQGSSEEEGEDDIYEDGAEVPEGDVEKGFPSKVALALQRTRSSKRSARDPKLVTWAGPDDPENPKNWSSSKKWAAVMTVSCFTFISPVSSSLVAPAIQTISAHYGVTNEVVAELMMSIFVLAYAIGPLFLGPLSEIYGRVIVLQLSNLFFLAFNIGCGFAQTTGQMIGFRFLAGLGGSAPLAIGGGVLSDCFKAEERGKSVAMYSLAPLLGPAIGPIAGGWITQKTSWRWGFHAVSIADACIQIGGLFMLKETYAPRLLQWKAQRLRKETGEDSWHTEAEKMQVSVWMLLRTSIVRPFILIATQPIVQCLALYMAYIYGLMYMMLSSFPSLWTGPEYYGESIGIGGLNYISLGLGFFVASQVGSWITDVFYRRLKARSADGMGKPEFRLPLLFGSAVLVPVGLFIYGWTAQHKTHWIGPNIGAFFVAAGVIPGFQGTQTYIIDAYTRYAASAVAAMAFLRSLAGFGFPLFSPYMYNALHYGWGNSLLGFVAIAIGCPAPFMLWKYGEPLRKKSTFAAG